jgi:hypothetical protein
MQKHGGASDPSVLAMVAHAAAGHVGATRLGRIVDVMVRTHLYCIEYCLLKGRGLLVFIMLYAPTWTFLQPVLNFLP